MKVVFIEPHTVVENRTVLYYRDAYGMEVPGSFPFPPIEIAYGAALLRNNGHEVRVLAANVLRLSAKDVVKRLSRFRADRVHIPVAWGSLEQDIALAEKIRLALPGCRISLSGTNVTIEPMAALGTGVVDEVLLGDFEAPLLELAEGKSPVEMAANVAFLDGSALVRRPHVLLDLSYLPTPALDLFDRDLYFVPFMRRKPYTLMETSRGCPYRCVFCVPVPSFYGRKIRFRPLDAIFEEFDCLERNGYREICFKDFNMTASRSHVVSICEELLRRNSPFAWRCASTVDRVDDELAELMKRSGCFQITFGFESGNQQVLDRTGKGTSIESAYTAVEACRRHGMETAGTFILGLPGETARTMEYTVRMALDLDLDYAQFFPFQIFPGSLQFTELAAPTSVSDYSSHFRWDEIEGRTFCELSAEELRRKLYSAYLRFYGRAAYWRRRFKKGGFANMTGLIGAGGHLAAQLTGRLFRRNEA